MRLHYGVRHMPGPKGIVSPDIGSQSSDVEVAGAGGNTAAGGGVIST